MDKDQLEEHAKNFRYPDYVPTGMLTNVKRAVDTKDYSNIQKQLKDENINHQIEIHHGEDAGDDTPSPGDSEGE